MKNNLPTITIYATQTCPYCKQEKAWLDEQGIAYTSHFVELEPDKREELIEKSGQLGVPVTVVRSNDREDVVIGFDRAKLAQLIGGR